MHLASFSRLSDPAASGAAPVSRISFLLAAAFCAAVALLLWVSDAAWSQAASSPDRAGETTPLGAATRAAGEGGDVTTGTGDGSSGGLVRTIIGLAVVIGVIYGITWILKQAKAAREPEDLGHGLAPAATLSLGGTRSVQLVRAGQEFLLLGVTDDGVSLLRTYSEQEARDAGFPVDDDDEPGTFKPLGGDDTPSGFAPLLLERVRELTVRR